MITSYPRPNQAPVCAAFGATGLDDAVLRETFPAAGFLFIRLA
jgi:hypothetical protein